MQDANEDLLKEILDYLVRLPAHPMTRALAERVQSHLDQSLTNAAQERADLMLAAMQGDRNGVSGFTPAGLPTLLLTVGLEAAHLSSPAARHYGNGVQGQRFAWSLAENLAKGIHISLKPRASEIEG